MHVYAKKLRPRPQHLRLAAAGHLGLGGVTPFASWEATKCLSPHGLQLGVPFLRLDPTMASVLLLKLTKGILDRNNTPK